jgi:hypothetical protein
MPPAGSSPIWAKRALKFGMVSALLIAALSLSTIGRGSGRVRHAGPGAGLVAGHAGLAMVGRSGNAAERWSLTASALRCRILHATRSVEARTSAARDRRSGLDRRRATCRARTISVPVVLEQPPPTWRASRY